MREWGPYGINAIWRRLFRRAESERKPKTGCLEPPEPGGAGIVTDLLFAAGRASIGEWPCATRRKEFVQVDCVASWHQLDALSTAETDGGDGWQCSIWRMTM